MKMKLMYSLMLTALLLFTSSVSALAQETSAEELLFMEIPTVITASKKSESIDVAPNVMYVITKEEIRKYGYRSISDIFNRLPGFFTSYRPLEPIAQVRGIAPNNNNKITYMINGHTVNNVEETTDLIPPYNLDNVERVEIIVGPGSVLYGADSLCAIVNMITKKMNGSEVIASAGGNASHMVSVMTGENLEGGGNIFLSGTYAKNDGWDSEAFYRHSGEKIGAEGKDVLSRKLGIIRPSKYLFGRAEVGAMSLQASSLNQAIPEYSQNRESIDVVATRYNYVDSFELQKNIKLGEELTSHVKVSYDSKRLLRAVEANYTGGILDGTRKLYTGEYGMEYKNEKNYFQTGLQGSIGESRHNYEIKNDNPGSTVPGTINHITDIFDESTFGGFVSEEYKASDKLSLVGAVRADSSNMSKDIKYYVSPRAAAVYNLTDTWILKAMYNTATKFSQPWESKYNQIWNYDRGAAWADVLGPADEPEILTTYEFQTIKYYNKVRLVVNGYSQELKDFIAWQNSHTNIGNFKGTGLEFDVKYAPVESLSLWINGGYQSAKFDSYWIGGDHGSVENPDGEMNSVPQITANMGGLYSVTKNFSFSSTIRYFTNQVVRRYPIPNYTMTIDEMKAYADANFVWAKVINMYYFDAALTWDNAFVENLGLRLSGKNLLDNRDRVAMQYANGDFQPEGRYIELTVSNKF